MQISSAPALAAARRPAGVPADLAYLFEPRDRFEQNQHDYQRDLKMDALGRGVFCGAVGGLLGNMQWWGFAAGAATGVYLAWDKVHQHEQGTATVNADGVVTRHQFYKDPSAYQVTAAQKEAWAVAQGEKQDHIGPGQRPQLNPAVTDTTWNGHAAELVKLEKERRLVADLGGKSEQGQHALHLVDAQGARQLMAAGYEVLAVTGQSQDIQHSFTVDSSTPDRQVTHRETSDWVERKFDYELTPLHAPDDLPGQGQGLPEGFLGVYAEATTCSERVYALDQDANLELGKNLRRQDQSTQRVSRDDAARLDRDNSVRVSHYLPLPHYCGLLGALAGTLTATACLPGQPTAMLGLLAGGVLGGREIGRFLVNHGVGKVGES